jgi:predicted DNA-binding transcriptional regulator YafY
LRADRLLTILLLLQSRGKVTSRELASLLETSERTVIRDMEALSAAGIPVFAERGRHGGWRLTDGYRTSLTGMKPKEMASLLLSADPAVLKDLGIQEEFSAASRKLAAVSSGSSAATADYFSQRIHVDSTGWHPTEESFPLLPLLQQALWEDRKVIIMYLRNGVAKERLIAPLGLVAQRSVWYLVGEHDGLLRTYRVSRILSAERTDDTFERPRDFNLPGYWTLSKESFKAALPSYPAKLIVNKGSLQVFEQERYVTLLSVDEHSNPAWVQVEAEFNTLESACRIVLSFGPGMIVISPEELRIEVSSAASATASLYEHKP